jgi:type I restriction enzyme, S subunit
VEARDFITEFSHVASAPGGIQRLREMIYQMAITGSLSKQIASEGHAEVLLRRAVEEKFRLISVGTFKRTPKLEASPLTVPKEGKLPDTWCWCRLVDLGEINPRNHVKDNVSATFVPMSGLPDRHSGELITEKRVWGDIKNGFTHFANGDVVLAKITPCFENGKAAVMRGLANGIGSGTTELHVFRPLQGYIDPGYVFIYLHSLHFTVEGINQMTGIAGQKRLPMEYFATRAFPLPPLLEQKRIVAKVNELMALCDKLESQYVLQEELGRTTRKSVFDHLIGSRDSKSLAVNWQRTTENMALWRTSQGAIEEFRNALCYLGCRGLLTEPSAITGHDDNAGMFALPAGWSWTTLEGLSEPITSGSRGWSQYQASQGDVFIRSQDIKLDKLVFDDKAFVVLPEQVEGKRTLVQPGDLLITITGANVGKCAKVPVLKEIAYVSQHIALVRVRDTRHTPFLHYWITNTFGGRKYLAKYIYGDKPGLNLSQVGSIPIPLPPQDAQDRIVAILNRHSMLCRQLGIQIDDAKIVAEALAVAMVSEITGISIQKGEKMKAPKTELVSTLQTGVIPSTKDHAPLSVILAKSSGELSAKALWSTSGLEIEAFYQQLKTEMSKGWIIQPEIAYVREIEAN